MTSPKVVYEPDEVGDIHQPPLEYGCMFNDCYHARGEPVPEFLRNQPELMDQSIKSASPRELLGEAVRMARIEGAMKKGPPPGIVH